MSILVPCFNRPDYDRYATSKSQGQLFLSGSLLADTLRELYDVVTFRESIEEGVFAVVIALVCVCLALEIIGLIFAGILMVYHYPCKKVDGVPVDAENGTSESAADGSGGATVVLDGKHCAELVARTPVNLKCINDGLTVISFMLVAIYAAKNAFYPSKATSVWNLISQSDYQTGNENLTTSP